MAVRVRSREKKQSSRRRPLGSRTTTIRRSCWPALGLPQGTDGLVPELDLLAVERGSGFDPARPCSRGRAQAVRGRWRSWMRGQLAFRDGSFDTVVSTLSTCTFPDPVEALREMRRVCRPGGRILLLEHGRSTRPGVAAWQDRRTAKHAAHLGCWWNREPLDNVRRAGLEPRSTTRTFLGIVHVIHANVLRPSKCSKTEPEPKLKEPLVQGCGPVERRPRDDVARRIDRCSAVEADYVRAVEHVR